jgi:hypothetical protein
LDATETVDTDNDGIGNNADTDDDDDGIPDDNDFHPLDATKSADTSPRVSNIATRGAIRIGDEVMIGGIIIAGTGSRDVLVRTRGPSLTDSNVAGVIADTYLRLFSGPDVIDENDDWQLHARASEVPAALAPTNSMEAAIYTTLTPGAYTAIVDGVNAETGVGIVEIFAMNNGKASLVNIATRGYIGTGDDVLIGGVIVEGDAPKTITFRARGPSLADFNVQGVVADPVMQLFDAQGTLLDTNDNWQDHASAASIRSDLAPTNPLEAAITVALQPGGYTVVIRGVNESSGVGIVEAFTVD